MADFKTRLKELRIENQLTQETLAKEKGLKFDKIESLR